MRHIPKIYNAIARRKSEKYPPLAEFAFRCYQLSFFCIPFVMLVGFSAITIAGIAALYRHSQKETLINEKGAVSVEGTIISTRRVAKGKYLATVRFQDKSHQTREFEWPWNIRRKHFVGDIVPVIYAVGNPDIVLIDRHKAPNSGYPTIGMMIFSFTVFGVIPISFSAFCCYWFAVFAKQEYESRLPKAERRRRRRQRREKEKHKTKEPQAERSGT